jgi:hypothetical protein
MPSDNTAQLVDSARRRHELTRAKRRADRCGGGLCVRGRDRHAAGIGQRQGCLPQLAGQGRLPAAYAMESLLQQVVFLSGPLLVAALTAASGPVAALACSAVLAAVGTVGFVVAAATTAPARGMPVASGRMAPGGYRRCGSWCAAQCCKA